MPRSRSRFRNSQKKRSREREPERGGGERGGKGDQSATAWSAYHRVKARADEAEAKLKSQDDEKKRRDEELSMTQKISQGITTALRMAGVVAPLPQPGAAGNPSET